MQENKRSKFEIMGQICEKNETNSNNDDFSFLQDLFKEGSTARNSFGNLSLPWPPTNYLKRSFSHRDSLPENIRKVKFNRYNYIAITISL